MSGHVRPVHYRLQSRSAGGRYRRSGSKQVGLNAARPAGLPGDEECVAHQACGVFNRNVTLDDEEAKHAARLAPERTSQIHTHGRRSGPCHWDDQCSCPVQSVCSSAAPPCPATISSSFSTSSTMKSSIDSVRALRADWGSQSGLLPLPGATQHN